MLTLPCLAKGEDDCRVVILHVAKSSWVVIVFRGKSGDEKNHESKMMCSGSHRIVLISSSDLAFLVRSWYKLKQDST
jgi:hypothetical protein